MVTRTVLLGACLPTHEVSQIITRARICRRPPTATWSVRRPVGVPPRSTVDPVGLHLFWLLVGSHVRSTDKRHISMSGRVMVGQSHKRKEVIRVAVYCFTQLIQPGKREEAKAVFEEIRETRRSEYEASRRRLGIREEKVWFQSLPEGDMAVVYWEGDDARAALREFASSDH